MKQNMKQLFSSITGSSRALVVIAFVLLFGGIGTYALLFGHAATSCTTTVSSVTAAQSAVSSAASGSVVCMSAGSYGSITVSGSHSGNVTFEPDPSLDPNGAGKVTFTGINVDGTYITVHNFYATGSINVGDGGGHDVIDHNAVGPTNGYGISVLPSTNDPSGMISHVTISGNIIHNTSSTGEGDALRFDNWSDILVTGNDIYNIAECSGDTCHTDTLQSYQADNPTTGLTLTKNYIHDTSSAQGFPFLKDGDISNVTITDNLSLRMASNNPVTGVWVDENVTQNNSQPSTDLTYNSNRTAGLTITNNTYYGTSGSIVQSDGSAGTGTPTNLTLALNHNIFDNFNVKTGSSGKAYAMTEDYDIFTGNNQYTFSNGPHSVSNSNPGFKCAPNCANGTPAGDDYELATNPNGIGIDWSPANQTYGPVDTSGGGTTTPPPPPTDTTPPTVGITAPANNATVSGTTAVTATAADNVGVSGVQFQVDGTNAGTADTASPYSYSWDTTKVSNGSHKLTAIAKDAAGNSTTSNTITVNVSNSGTTPPPTSSCFSSPGSCGYPDPASKNVGVANCSALTASGSVTAQTAGQTIQNLNITGTITISANNVTVNNVCVTDNASGKIGSSAIFVNSGVTGTVINNSTVSGANTSNQSVEAVISNGNSGPSGTASKDNLLNCGECIHGNWTVNDSYVTANGMVGTGDHLEDWYFNDGTVSANHDTMLNSQGPTAILFGDTRSGGGGAADNHITFTNSLVAGGGFMFYPYGNASSVGTGTINISNNRFARCLLNGAAAVTDSAGGRVCPGVAIGTNDGHGYYPYGGYFGVADFYSSGSCQTWSGNFWDDNQATVNISDGGSLAGATVLAPPTSGAACSTTPPSDTTPPTVSLTAPSSGATISGTTTVNATASDNVGVSSVQLQVDGANVGSADTSSPYSFSLDTTKLSNGSHKLTAVAKDAAGNSTTSGSVTVTVNNAPPVPATPTALHSTATTQTSISLAWTDTDSNVSGYLVYRSGTLVKTISTATTSFTDTGLMAGTAYSYTVEAYDSGNTGNSSLPTSPLIVNTAAAQQSIVAPTKLTGSASNATTISLSWTASTSSNVSHYYVVRSSANSPAATIATLGNVTNFTDSPVLASTAYTYYVMAGDSSGNFSAPSNSITATTPKAPDTTPPTVPAGLTAIAVSPTQVNLSWSASTDNSGQVAGYYVFRSDKGSAVYATVTNGTSWGESNLVSSTTYTYTVKAYDASNNISAASIAASVKTPAQPITSGPTIVGTTTVGSQIDGNNSGMAEAFQTTATTSGSVAKIHVYIDRRSRATKVVVGLYQDTGGQAGPLMAQGTTTTLTSGAWNVVPIPTASITAKHTYWIAILSVGSGNVAFRDVNNGKMSAVSSKTNLTTLPAQWSSGTLYKNSPISAYATN
jgi:chitodextrinase